ncbi:hypothetical protein P154DRAFT_576777 [Amniculicola lignicola CBS 123094]|uniref:Uncharacterized protein n=1 Tax=Amniculicola lignicola CBS 123094 TaxID=1392246 RepID=A0A6A5WPR4_9PLEO|nr:hypothetical protein P154DRAFT_576777 [Amniculicola lignicola CBS 123094]
MSVSARLEQVDVCDAAAKEGAEQVCSKRKGGDKDTAADCMGDVQRVPKALVAQPRLDSWSHAPLVLEAEYNTAVLRAQKRRRATGNTIVAMVLGSVACDGHGGESLQGGVVLALVILSPATAPQSPPIAVIRALRDSTLSHHGGTQAQDHLGMHISLDSYSRLTPVRG